ncbi:hypothetical protein [Rhodoflexus sp.]
MQTVFRHTFSIAAPLLYKQSLVLLLFILMAHLPVAWRAHHTADINMHVLQAEAWLNGRMDIPFYQHDMAIYQERFYVVYPPIPALLLLPMVAVVGVSNVTAVVLAALALYLAMIWFDRLATALGADSSSRQWLTVAFFAGTAVPQMVLTTHNVIALSHIVCVAFLLGGLQEFFGKQRVWLVACYFGAAFLCRQLTAFYGLFVLLALFSSADRQWFRTALTYAAVSLPFIAVYLLCNYARFGNPLDTGYQYLKYVGILGERVQQHGVFSFHYMPFNFYYLFLKGHDVVFGGADGMQPQGMDLFGTSLTVASPFLFAAFYQRLPRMQLIAALTAVSIITFLLLGYHNNGWHQVNTQRFTLDFLPLLMILVISGWHRIPAKIAKALVVYAVVLNIGSIVFHYITRS